MKKSKEGKPVKGFTFSGVASGIKATGRKDIALIISYTPATVAGVFTKNSVKAAPVIWSQSVAKNGICRAIVVNSGNANACTGDRGKADTKEMASIVAKRVGCKLREVAVSSTGIIGVPLPMDKVRKGIEKGLQALSPACFSEAAEAIMTTDTFSKSSTVDIDISGQKVRLTAMAKGSGMINPNMATMLAFIVTDVAITQPLLKEALAETAEFTFNRITVDGEMSTNDTVMILANGAAQNRLINKKGKDYNLFKDALLFLSADMAEKIIRDGEGATKFVKIGVKGAETDAAALEVANKIANSSLVKTAIFGEDPNWGRIVSAAGSCKAKVYFDKIDLLIGTIPIISTGRPTGQADKGSVKKYLKKKDIAITLNLNLGKGEAEVLTTDLTYEYIRINSAYSS
ncbi:MAG: bifunctional glutamate N-acetyltransferase/amino-acid acetyltransferase ArgJ [Nitrospinota bacterium]